MKQRYIYTMRVTIIMEPNVFVTYLLYQQTEQNKLAIENFIANQEKPTKIIDTFVEILKNNRNYKWSILQKAIASCKEHQATLLIAELGTLTNKENFVNILLNAGIKFYCIDQPFVDHGILEALHKHSKIQKKQHGELIKKGLEKTLAKSGNPNAAMVIGEVNKPKIDAAIVFAFLLQPIVANYKEKGFSQRQMVKTLNEEGFTAPEGGKWVLSQLQKVLDRVKINEIAMKIKPVIEPLLQQNQNNIQIAEELNKQQITSIKAKLWDEEQVKKILFRLEQIADIENTNNFIINLLPTLHKFKSNDYSINQILKCFQNNKINI